MVLGVDVDFAVIEFRESVICKNLSHRLYLEVLVVDNLIHDSQHLAVS